MGGFVRRERERERDREGDIFIFYFFIFFVSLSDLRKSNRRFSLGLKAKLIHAARATRGYSKSWSFVKLHEVGNFPTCVISSLKAI